MLNHALGPSLIQWLDTPHRFKNLQKVFDIIFFAYVSVVNHALPLLEKSRGSVVILNSINGESRKILKFGFHLLWAKRAGGLNN